MSRTARNILVLYWHPEPSQLRAAIRQHLRALEASPGHHRIVYANAYGPLPSWVRIAPFDVIVLHTTFLCLRWSHLFPAWKWSLRWIAKSQALKVAMPQDEYDHADVLDEWLQEWGVHTVFSNFDEPLRSALYPLRAGDANFRKALTGYIDSPTAERLADTVPPIDQRQIDLVYRATHLPYWFGSHGQVKHRIAEVVADGASARGLRTDISTRPYDTIVGEAWFDFLASSRSVLGCESGSSVIDHRGEVRAQIQMLLREDPHLDFDAVSRRMPEGWDGHAFFAISPRHLESVMTHTAQVLIEGRYDGILEAGRHYIPLRRDFSNLNEVLEAVADPMLLTRVAETAHREIYKQGRASYGDLAREFDEAIASARTGRLPLIRVMAWWGRRRLHGEVASPSPSLAGWVIRHPDHLRVAFHLIRTQKPLSRLLRGYLRSRAAWRSVRPAALLDELVVIGLARRAQSGYPTAGEQFRVEPSAESTPELLQFVSRPPGELTGEADRRRCRAVLSSGPLIRFDHSRAGGALHYALSKHHWVSINPAGGVIDLRALSRLNRLLPDLVKPVITPLIDAPASLPSSSSIISRLRLDPALYTAKAAVGLKALLVRPALRSLYRGYLRNRVLRQTISPTAVLEDLVKLSLTDLVPIRVSYSRDDATLLLTTTVADVSAARCPTDGPLERVVWDNSAGGGYVLAPVAGGKRLTFWLGVDGRYEFRTLPALRRAMPERVDAVLAAIGRSKPD